VAHVPGAEPATPAQPAPKPAPEHHTVAAPAHAPEAPPPAAVVLALAASAPLAGISAKISSLGGVVPLPGWSRIQSSLLASPAGGTAVLGGIALAASMALGFGSYACTRLRRLLARLW
jgi:hypothetical protein